MEHAIISKKPFRILQQEAQKMNQGRSLGGDGDNYVNPSLDIISVCSMNAIDV